MAVAAQDGLLQRPVVVRILAAVAAVAQVASDTGWLGTAAVADTVAAAAVAGPVQSLSAAADVPLSTMKGLLEARQRLEPPVRAAALTDPKRVLGSHWLNEERGPDAAAPRPIRVDRSPWVCRRAPALSGRWAEAEPPA